MAKFMEARKNDRIILLNLDKVAYFQPSQDGLKYVAYDESGTSICTVDQKDAEKHAATIIPAPAGSYVLTICGGYDGDEFWHQVEKKTVYGWRVGLYGEVEPILLDPNVPRNLWIFLPDPEGKYRSTDDLIHDSETAAIDFAIAQLKEGEKPINE